VAWDWRQHPELASRGVPGRESPQTTHTPGSHGGGERCNFVGSLLDALDAPPNGQGKSLCEAPISGPQMELIGHHGWQLRRGYGAAACARPRRALRIELHRHGAAPVVRRTRLQSLGARRAQRVDRALQRGSTDGQLLVHRGSAERASGIGSKHDLGGRWVMAACSRAWVAGALDAGPKSASATWTVEPHGRSSSVCARRLSGSPRPRRGVGRCAGCRF